MLSSHSINKLFIGLSLTIILLLSLTVNSSFYFDGSIYGQGMFQYLVLAIAGFTFLTWGSKKSLVISYVDLGVFLFLSFLIIRSLVKNPSFNHETRLFEYLCFIAIYIFTRWISNKKDSTLIISILTGFILLEALYGYGQYFGFLPSSNAFFQVTGTYSNSAVFAGLMVLGAPLVFSVFPKQHTTICRICKLLTFGLVVGAIFLSQSRAGILSIGIASILMLLERSGFSNYANYKKIVIAILASLLIATSVALLYKIRPDSADGRLMIWKITTAMTGENLLVGGGPGHFEGKYNYYQGKFLSSSEATDRDKYLSGEVQTAFNEYLNHLVNFGIVGLILLALIVFLTCRAYVEFLKKKQPVYLPVALISIFVFAFFSYPFHVISINTMVFVLLAVTASQVSVEKYGNHHPVKYKVMRLIGTSLLLLTIPIYYYLGSISKWKTAQELAQYNPAESLILYAEAKENLQRDIPFLYNYAAQLADLGYYRKSLEIFKELEREHLDIKICSQIARCYEAIGEFSMAEKYLKIAIGMQPLLGISPKVATHSGFKLTPFFAPN